jgi:SAM-dependent methyltransferase
MCANDIPATLRKTELVRSGYNVIAAEYLKARSKDSEDLRLLEELETQLPRGSKILDAGCGAGVPVSERLSRSFDVLGIDIAEEQVELARRLVPRARFRCADMVTLDLPDASFDAICCYYAIIHVPRREHRRILRNFHRMLRPGGLLLACLGVDDLPSQLDDAYHGVRMYWSHYGALTNWRMIEECGFEILRSEVIADATYGDSRHLFVLARRRAGPSPRPVLRGSRAKG